MLWSARKYRRGSFWHVYGPLMMTIVAGFLVMADLTRHVLVDAGVWTGPSGSEYRNNCNEETMRCFSATGWIVTFGCTYLGFFLLFYGTLWNANIIAKVKELYAQCGALYRRYKAQKQDSTNI